VINNDLLRIGGALSKFRSGGRGPTLQQIQPALLVAGYNGPPTESNKQQLVLGSFAAVEDDIARRIAEELLALLRETKVLDDTSSPDAEQPRSVTEDVGHEFNQKGQITWHNNEPAVGKTSAFAQRKELAGEVQTIEDRASLAILFLDGIASLLILPRYPH
jgi:hypothetical protein